MHFYKHKKITVMGLGLHGGGIASAGFFARLGADVTVTDLKSEVELKSSLARLARHKNITYVLGRHRLRDFTFSDLIIRNPAVPHNNSYLQAARTYAIPVHTDVSWSLDLLQKNQNTSAVTVIGVTGTKGKSSTATLLYRVLEHCGKKAILAGNIRQSPLDFLVIKNHSSVIRNSQFVILELSSWQIESLYEHKLSPDIAVITNILQDHLNRHTSFDEYARTKFFIAAHQRKTDAFFVNARDPMSQKLAKKLNNNRIIWFGKDHSQTKLPHENLHPDTISAITAVARFLKLPTQKTRRAIQSFSGLTGRLELIAEKRGVRYYNDTCATQPDATAFAIKTIKTEKLRSTNGNLILIVGGSDKGLNYCALARTIKKYCAQTIIYKGAPTDTASDKILAELQKLRAKNIYCEHTLKKSVALATYFARKGDVVLFSPAASSFGRFKHEFDRGEQFQRAVMNIN